jgi:hypothetical protein
MNGCEDNVTRLTGDVSARWLRDRSKALHSAISAISIDTGGVGPEIGPAALHAGLAYR